MEPLRSPVIPLAEAGYNIVEPGLGFEPRFTVYETVVFTM